MFITCIINRQHRLHFLDTAFTGKSDLLGFELAVFHILT